MTDAKTVQTQKTPPPTQKGTAPSKRKSDTRAPEEIFRSRFNNEARLMTRRFASLSQLGNAKRARPTQSQLDSAFAWLDEQVEKVKNDLQSSLNAPADMKEAARDKTGFRVI